MIIDEELVAEFVASVAEALDGLAFEQRLTVAKATKLDLIRPYVLGEVTRRESRRPGFQHVDAHTLLGQLFGHPAATRS